MIKELLVEDEIIEVIEDEQEDYYSNDDLYNISSWGADLSFRELIDRYKDGDLVKPEMQRNYVWDKAEASRFIDSILLGLPVPSIFLSKTTDEKMLIVDGYQRIMTVYDYVRGVFSKDKRAFHLTNSKKINERWRGKTFEELSDAEQRKIKNTTIHCIIFAQLKPKNDTSLYQVFERINTSGRTLVPQEIRNCIYQGDFNSLLIKLNTDANWRELYGLDNPDSRMRDMEFVLRFFALGETNWNAINLEEISLKKFLNEFMGSTDSKKAEILAEREESFLQTVQFIHQYMDSGAFQNLSLKDPEKLAGKFNPTIYDSIMIATQIALKKNSSVKTEELLQHRMELLRNKDYQDLIRFRTTKTDRIRQRIAMALKYLYGVDYE